MKDKIEEIYVDFKKTFITSPDWGFEFDTDEFKKWLSTLIQSERKEAVKAFVEWAKLEPKIFYGHSYIQKALTDAVDDYLKERGNL